MLMLSFLVWTPSELRPLHQLRRIVVAISALALSINAPVNAASFNWPDLPTKGFVVGRPATQKDVAMRRAAFSLRGASLGVIPVVIPQYVFYKDDDGLHHGVLIQAERGPNNFNLAGILLTDGTTVVVPYPNVTLLGKNKPAR
jgi:hypothetical protein